MKHIIDINTHKQILEIMYILEVQATLINLITQALVDNKKGWGE